MPSFFACQPLLPPLFLLLPLHVKPEKLLAFRRDEHVLEIGYLRRHAARQAPRSACCPRQGHRVPDRVLEQGE